MMGKTYTEQLGQPKTNCEAASLLGYSCVNVAIATHCAATHTHTRINTAFFHLGGDGGGAITTPSDVLIGSCVVLWKISSYA
jgi:hypothetical protein